MTSPVAAVFSPFFSLSCFGRVLRAQGSNPVPLVGFCAFSCVTDDRCGNSPPDPFCKYLQRGFAVFVIMRVNKETLTLHTVSA